LVLSWSKRCYAARFASSPAKAGLEGPTVEGILWRAAEMIFVASLCARPRISLAVALARTSSALSAALVWIFSPPCSPARGVRPRVGPEGDTSPRLGGGGPNLRQGQLAQQREPW
jgi:hypothetical protein